MNESPIFRKKYQKTKIHNSIHHKSFNNQKREIFMCNNIINQLKEQKRKEKENVKDYIGTICVTKEDDLDSETQMFIITDNLTEDNLSSLQIIKKPKFTVKLIIEMLYMFLNFPFMNWLEFQEKINIFDLKLKMSSISFQKLEPFKVNMYINKLFNCNKNINAYFSTVLGKDYDSNINYLSEGMKTFLHQNEQNEFKYIQINKNIKDKSIKYQDDNINRSMLSKFNNDSNISNYENEQNNILDERNLNAKRQEHLKNKNSINMKYDDNNDNKSSNDMNMDMNIENCNDEIGTFSNDQIKENNISNNEFIKKLQKGLVETYLNNNSSSNNKNHEDNDNIYSNKEKDAAKVGLAIFKWIKCCFKRYIYYYNKTKNELDNIKMYKDALIMLHVSEMKNFELKKKEYEDDKILNLSKITDLSKANKQDFIPILKCHVDEQEFNIKYQKKLNEIQNNRNVMKKTETELISKTNNTTSRVRIKELNKSIESISSKISFKNTFIKEIEINNSKKSLKNYSKLPSLDDETTRHFQSKSNLMLTELKNTNERENNLSRSKNKKNKIVSLF